MNTWARRKGESKEAYAAFEIYYTLEPDERSLEAVSRKCGKSVSLLARWSALKKWVSRAADYDAHMTNIRQKEREKQAAKWEKRREELRFRQVVCELGDARRMRKKAIDILEKLPLQVEVAPKKDEESFVIMPASSAEYRAANDLLKTAREFVRGALEMPTRLDRQELTGKDGEAVKVKTEQMTDEELERIASMGSGAGAFGAAKSEGKPS